MPWWSRSAPAEEPVPDEVDDEEVDDAEGEDEEDEEPDEAVDARAERLLGQRAAAMQKKLAAFGLSLSDEGEPVISDPRRLREWMGPLGDAAEEAGMGANQPAPAAAAAAAAAEEAGEWDVLELTPEKLQKMIRAEAEKIAAPLQAKLERQESLVGKRWIDEATARAAAAIAEYAPDYVHIVDHPQFAGLFKSQLAKMDPQWLENSQALGSTALGLLAFLDPKQMPRRQASPEAAARGMVNRMNVPAMTPAGAGDAALARSSREYQNAAQFLADARIVSTTPEDLEAVDAVDAWGFHTVDAYKAALEKRGKGRKVRR